LTGLPPFQRGTSCHGRVRSNPHKPQTDDAAPAMPAEAELLAVMERSNLDVASRLLPLADALAEKPEEGITLAGLPLPRSPCS